jgi:hypothetical protein
MERIMEQQWELTKHVRPMEHIMEQREWDHTMADQNVMVVMMLLVQQGHILVVLELITLARLVELITLARLELLITPDRPLVLRIILDLIIQDLVIQGLEPTILEPVQKTASLNRSQQPVLLALLADQLEEWELEE